jgi:hypothetical protein
MPYMKVVIDTMKEKGIRDDYVVLVGGAPLNEEFGKAVGADAYCRDAAVAVETAKEFIAPQAQPARQRLSVIAAAGSVGGFGDVGTGVLGGVDRVGGIAADTADGVGTAGRGKRHHRENGQTREQGGSHGESP